MKKGVPTCLDVDKIIANLGRRHSGSVVYIDVCPPEVEGRYLTARRGKRQEKVFCLLLDGLKRKLRQMGYVIVVTPEAKRKIKEWKKERKEQLEKALRRAGEMQKIFDRQRRHLPKIPHPGIFGGRVAA